MPGDVDQRVPRDFFMHAEEGAESGVDQGHDPFGVRDHNAFPHAVQDGIETVSL